MHSSQGTQSFSETGSFPHHFLGACPHLHGHITLQRLSYWIIKEHKQPHTKYDHKKLY